MSFQELKQCVCVTTATLVVWLTGVTALVADDGAQGAESDDQQAELYEKLQSYADQLEVEADATLPLRPTPLMTFTDPNRGTPAAGVWRIGETGRPLGIVAIEYWENFMNGGFLSYEVVSCHDGETEISGSSRLRLRLSGNAIEMHEFPDAPRPEASKTVRLMQMKELFGRFLVEETFEGQPVGLDPLVEPIDRYEDYEDADNEIVDGAIFVFAFGRNPELLFLIECDGNSWSYGLARLSSARLRVTLDDEEIADFPALKWPQPTPEYQSAGHRVSL